jgi:hypothetical protein
MNKITMLSKTFRLIICTALLLSGQSFAALISVDVPEGKIFPGDNIPVAIIASDFEAEKGIGAFNFNLSYDATILELTDYTMSDALGSLDDADASDMSSLAIPGELNCSVFSLLTPSELIGMQEVAELTIANIAFRAKESGISALSLTVNDIGDAYGEMISCATRDSRVMVPEPSTIALSCCGFFMLMTIPALRKKSIWKGRRTSSVAHV